MVGGCNALRKRLQDEMCRVGNRKISPEIHPSASENRVYVTAAGMIPIPILSYGDVFCKPGVDHQDDVALAAFAAYQGIMAPIRSLSG